MELYWHDELVADIPIQPLSEEAPILDRPTSKHTYLETIKDVEMNKDILPQDAYHAMIQDMEVVDKSWVYNQYDSMVQTNTIKGPGTLDASVIRIKETGKALAMSADCNTRFCYIDPQLGSSAAVMEAGRNVAMSGAQPLAITDCLNFGNPENPEGMWQSKYSCEGIKEACKELTTPVIGGNVSLYNETNGVGVFPTPSIATVGVNEDMNNVLHSILKEDGNLLYILGETKSEFGGSLYLKKLYNKIAGTHPEVDFSKELTLWKTVIEGNKKNLFEAAKDVGVGGLAISLSKMAARGNKGCKINIDLNNQNDIFSETLSRAIVEVNPSNKEAFESFAKETGIYYNAIGTVGGDLISINNTVNINLESLKSIYFNRFQEVVEQDL
jgi:phosphoribosylformylglycinamidine synthase